MSGRAVSGGEGGRTQGRGRDRGAHAADVVDVILTDHGHIRARLAELDRLLKGPGPPRPPAALGQAWAALAASLECHLDTETEVCGVLLYGNGAVADQCRAIAGDLRETIKEAELNPPGSDLWRLAFRALRVAALRHLAAVESDILRRFRDGTPPRERLLLAEQWASCVRARDLDARSIPGDLAGTRGSLVVPDPLVAPVRVGDEPGERVRELVQLGEVSLSQVGHQLVALLRELHANDAGVLQVLAPAHETGGLRAVYQAHRAVALQQQVLGDIPDGRRQRPMVTLDRHKQLVLHMGKADRGGLLLAPALKAAQLESEGQVVLEVLSGGRNVVILLNARATPGRDTTQGIATAPPSL